MLGASIKTVTKTCVTFVSQSSVENLTIKEYQLGKLIVPVRDFRSILKKNLIDNDATAQIDVNPENYG